MGNFRKAAAGIATAVLFGLIIISFLFIGNGGNGLSGLQFNGSNDVVVAGSRHLSPQRFKMQFSNAVQALSQQYQRQITDQEAIDNHIDEQMLPSVAANEAELEAIRRMGIKPSPAEIAEQLRTQTAFFNPVSGKFDRKQYVQTLAEHDLTPKVYEQSIADQLAIEAFNTGAAAGIKAPRAYAAFVSVYNKQARSISYITLDQSKVAAPGKPTDAQLTAFMKDNAAGFTLPETRVLSIVRFSAKALAPTMPVDESLIQKQFNFRKDAESKPETRSLIQVTTKDQNVANQAQARMAKGEDPQAVAKALGAQAVVYDDKPKTAVPDPKVGTVAFSMKVGEVSGAIKGDLGYSVVKVTGISPGKEADLATMRPQLEAAVKQQEAEQKVTEEADKFEQVSSSNSDLGKAAAAAGATVVTTPAIVAQGVDPDTNKPVDGTTPKLLQVAFKQPAGAVSDIENDGAGEYFVVRTDKIIPPHLVELDKVRADVEKLWTQKQINDALKAKGDALAARLRKGESLEAVAASAGAKVETLDGVSRDAASQQGNPIIAKVGQDLVARAFDAKKGDIFEAAGPQQSADPKTPAKPTLFVARLDDIQPGDVNATAQLAANTAQTVDQSLTSELGQMIQVAAKNAINPKVYPDRAKRALGVEPSKTPAQPKGKAG